ncbi:hypothetical protein D1007_03862 [Hordeum vulgare]|nr:hypothetical protein D1007_03862 [Hordeum vulgare]
MRHRVNKGPPDRVTPLQRGASLGAHAHPPPGHDRAVPALVPVRTSSGTAGEQQLAAETHIPPADSNPIVPTTTKADAPGTARLRALLVPDQDAIGATSASAELALVSQVPDSQPGGPTPPVSPAAWSGQSGATLTPAARDPPDASDQTPQSCTEAALTCKGITETAAAEPVLVPGPLASDQPATKASLAERTPLAPAMHGPLPIGPRLAASGGATCHPNT